MTLGRRDFGGYHALGVDLDGESGVLTVTLTNPERRNAVTAAMDDELQSIFIDAWKDERVLAVVLTGSGDSFCAGTDLGDLPDDDSDAQLRGLGGAAKRIFFSMLDCEKPLIAKVRGPAYGLGANLALACDVVFADTTAKFCDSHVTLGLAPGDGGAALWPLLVGFAKAKELLLTGAVLTGQQAADLGLIAHCVASDDLDGRVLDFARKLAAQPPLAVAYTKASMNVMLRQMLGGAFEASLAYDLLTLRTNGHRHAMQQASERRSPRNRTEDPDDAK